MVSLLNKPKNTSTHGRLLLNELALPFDNDYSLQTQIEEKLTKCRQYLKVDENACILRIAESGNTAYHVLVGSDFPEEFILPLLHDFYHTNPAGVTMKNKQGNLPLHFALSQQDIIESVARLLLQFNPESAGNYHENTCNLMRLKSIYIFYRNI